MDKFKLAIIHNTFETISRQDEKIRHKSTEVADNVKQERCQVVTTKTQLSLGKAEVYVQLPVAKTES